MGSGVDRISGVSKPQTIYRIMLTGPDVIGRQYISCRLGYWFGGASPYSDDCVYTIYSGLTVLDRMAGL